MSFAQRRPMPHWGFRIILHPIPMRSDILIPCLETKNSGQSFVNGRSCPDFDINTFVLGKNRLITISTTTYLDVQSNVLSFSIAILSQKDVISQVTKRLGHYAKATFQDIIGESQAISKAMKLAAKAAALKTNILLLGESGVGKDIFAQAIHNASNQRQGPFVTLNCAAIPRRFAGQRAVWL